MNFYKKIVSQNTVLQDAIYANIGVTLNKVLMLAFVVIISRYFGAEQFGYYGTANTYNLVIYTILSFGSSFLLTREIASDPSTCAFYYNTISKLRVLFFGIVLLLFTFFLSFIAYPLPLKLLIFLFIIQGFVKSSLQQVFAMFQGYKLFKLQVLIEVFVYIGLVICALIVWQAKMSIVNLGVLMLITFLIIWLLSLLVIKKKLMTFDFFSEWKKDELLYVLNRSLPFFFGTVIGILYHRVGILLLGWVDGQYEVGLYVAPYDMYEASLFIPATVGNVLFPTLVQYIQKKDYAFIHTNVNKINYYLLLILIPIIVMFLLGGKDIVILFFGNEYQKSGLVLQIVSVSLIFHVFNNILGRLLYAMNEEKYQVKITIYSLLFNVLTCFIFIPVFSFNGVAIAAVLSFLFSFMLHYYKVKTLINGLVLIKWTQLFRSLLTFMVCCIIFFLLKYYINSIILIGVGLVISHLLFAMFLDKEVFVLIKNYISSKRGNI